MSRCMVCGHPQRDAIELDRVNGMLLSAIADKYGLTHRQAQYHFQRHWTAPKPDSSPRELQDRLDRLVSQAEQLLTDSDQATYGQKTKAITALNSVLRLALQTAGQLKQLAPTQATTTVITDTREYRELVAKVNEAVVCEKCRGALKSVL